MSDSLNNKELVAVGHQLAQALSSNTPIIDIAKILSRLAERLDSTTGALGGTQAQRDQLAAENAALKEVVSGVTSELYGQGFEVSGWHLNGALEPLDNWFTDNGWGIPETPATDAFLAEIRVQARNELIDELESKFRRISETSLTHQDRVGAGAAAEFVSISRQRTAQ